MANRLISVGDDLTLPDAVIVPAARIPDLAAAVDANTDWANIAGKPATFPATAHNHAIADTTGLQTALDGKAASSHSHTIANTTGLQTALDAKAPLASPGLTGTPTAPTAAQGTNTTQIATTAFVTAEIATDVPTATDTVAGRVELATTAEATTGTDTTRAVTPAGLKAVADTKAASGHTHTPAQAGLPAPSGGDGKLLGVVAGAYALVAGAGFAKTIDAAAITQASVNGANPNGWNSREVYVSPTQVQVRASFSRDDGWDVSSGAMTIEITLTSAVATAINTTYTGSRTLVPATVTDWDNEIRLPATAVIDTANLKITVYAWVPVGVTECWELQVMI